MKCRSLTLSQLSPCHQDRCQHQRAPRRERTPASECVRSLTLTITPAHQPGNVLTHGQAEAGRLRHRGGDHGDSQRDATNAAPPGYPSLINNPKVFTLEGYYIGPVPVPAPIPGAPDIWREVATNGLTARFGWPPTEPGIFLIVVKVQVRDKNGQLVTVCTARQTIDLTRGPKVNASTTPAAPPTTATAQPTRAPQPTRTPQPTPSPPTPRPTSGG